MRRRRRGERFSGRALEVLSAMGLTTDDACVRWAGQTSRRIGERARELEERTPAGEVVAIVGPSGSGKTRLLGMLARRVRARGGRCVVVRPAARREGRVVDALGAAGAGGAAGAMRALCAAGLADARLMVAPIETLSEGERWRLGLACALERAEVLGGEVTLMADEFGGALDGLTAAAISTTIARRVRRAGMRAFIATHRGEVVANLGAPRVVVMSGEPGGPAGT